MINSFIWMHTMCEMNSMAKIYNPQTYFRMRKVKATNQNSCTVHPFTRAHCTVYTMQHAFIYYYFYLFLLLFTIPLAVTNESENCGSQMDFCQVFSVLFTVLNAQWNTVRMASVSVNFVWKFTGKKNREMNIRKLFSCSIF